MFLYRCGAVWQQECIAYRSSRYVIYWNHYKNTMTEVFLPLSLYTIVVSTYTLHMYWTISIWFHGPLSSLFVHFKWMNEIAPVFNLICGIILTLRFGEEKFFFSFLSDMVSFVFLPFLPYPMSLCQCHFGLCDSFSSS